MDIRQERQQEAVDAYLASDGRSIINACPRFGKIKVAIDISTKLQVPRALIFAPRVDIFKGWQDDFKKYCVGYPTHVEYITFAGIKKLETELWNVTLVIIDEPHEMSVNQQLALKEKLKDYKGKILGLTGTMTDKTRQELFDSLNLDTCYKYDINQGVEDGILADYEIIIHQIPLDNFVKRFMVKGKLLTEKQHFNLWLAIREGKKSKERWFMDVKLIGMLQNSITKHKLTVDLINRYKNDRLLVFCGVTAVADMLGIPVYHSKAREKEIFKAFCEGHTYNQLATIKMMQAGITITPIDRGIINYMSGNPEDSAQKICRFLGFEYKNPDKKAEIHIVSSNEPFELSRLKTGLVFFDQSKITYKA